MIDFNSPEYKRSRVAYVCQQTVEYFVALLVTDAFLAKLLSSLGISDALIGIISSFITLAFVVQMFSIFLSRVKMSTKYIVLLFDTVSIIFFMLMYLIPFIHLGHTGRTLLMMLCVFIAYTCKYLVISVAFKWGNSFVDPNKRGSFSATKEMVSLFAGMAFTALSGYVIDRFEGLDNLNGGFLFIAVTIFILNICNFACFATMAKEPNEDVKADSPKLVDVFKNTVGNIGFRKVIILTIMFDAARYASVGFMGIYKTKDLMFSAFTVQLINIVASGMRMAVSPAFGKYSDKKSFVAGFKLGLILMCAGYIVTMFTTPSTRWLIAVYTILTYCATAGTNANSYNIAYSYVDPEYISQAMAIKNCIGGLVGFGTSVVAGKVLSLIQANGNIIFGVHIYPQQFLSGISLIIMVIAIVYINKSLINVPRQKN